MVIKIKVGAIRTNEQDKEVCAINAQRAKLDRVKENVGVTVGNAKRVQQIEQMETVLRTMKDKYINKYNQSTTIN
jgi:hypothetical protein